MPIGRLSQELVAEIAASYPGLRVLNLAGNEIERVEHLAPLSTLESLSLARNRIKVPSSLQRSSSLGMQPPGRMGWGQL